MLQLTTIAGYNMFVLRFTYCDKVAKIYVLQAFMPVKPFFLYLIQ